MRLYITYPFSAKHMALSLLLFESIKMKYTCAPGGGVGAFINVGGRPSLSLQKPISRLRLFRFAYLFEAVKMNVFVRALCYRAGILTVFVGSLVGKCFPDTTLQLFRTGYISVSQKVKVFPRAL